MNVSKFTIKHELESPILLRRVSKAMIKESRFCLLGEGVIHGRGKVEGKGKGASLFYAMAFFNSRIF